MPLYFILPRRLGTSVGRRGIMAGFRIYAWSLSITRTYRLDLRAVDTLRGGPPVILAPNHPCLIDALLILTRHPNIVCVMKAALMRNAFLGSGSRLARYVRNDSSRQMVKESVAHLQRRRRAAAVSRGHPHHAAADQSAGGQRRIDREACGGPGADAGHRDRFTVLEQGLAAVQTAHTAHRLSGQAGPKRFDAPLGRRGVHG
jgi:hypothetical protein